MAPDATRIVFDPHIVWAIGLTALAIVIALLTICVDIDRPAGRGRR